MAPRFSVIVATLLRPSYPALVASLRRQTFADFELVARADVGPGVNEYVARNRAVAQATGEVLVFLDDDATARPDHLARLDRAFRERPGLVAVSGALRGDMWGQGVQDLDKKGWWVGANLAIRADVFRELGGFEESWGLPEVPRGWRADTDIGWRIEDHYPGWWVHDGTLVVDHPGPMGSVWQPQVEGVFFRRHRARCLERFVPVDPRLQQFLLETQDLAPPETARVLKCRRDLRQFMPGLPVLPQEGA
jgi:hypothetical protein